jgi:tetratricopeptide (TPR) repeat protein
MTRLIVLRATVLTLIAVLAAPAFLALPKEKDKWVRVETANFTLLSNAGSRRAAKVGKRLEQLREVLTETSKGMTYNLRADGTPDEAVAGYFVRSVDGNYVAIDASAEAQPYPVIYHEYLHYFLENNIPAIPLWLNEGIAEFYSTFTIRDGRAEIGLFVQHHLLWLQQREWISLDDLFGVDTSSPIYNEGDPRGTFYAQSWALAHYLLLDERRRDRMGRLFRLVSQGTPSAEAFEQAIEIDLPTAQKELLEHLSSKYDRFIRYTPQENLDEQSAVAVPLERREVLYHLGDLLLHHSPLQGQAVEGHLLAALELDPEFADAYAALAGLRLVQGRPDDAIELCEKTLAIAAKHPRASGVYGGSLMAKFAQSVTEDDPLTETPPPLLLRAREQFRGVLALAPDHAEALYGLGVTYLAQTTDLDEGIDALTRAWHARPAQTNVLVNLIVLKGRAGEIEDAKSLLERSLRPRGDAESIQLVETELARIGFQRVQELIVQNKSDEAIALARQIAEGISDGELRRELLEATESVSSISEAEQARIQFERVRQLIDQDKPEEALTLARRVAARVSDDKLRRELLQVVMSISSALEIERIEDLRNEALAAGAAGDAEKAEELLRQVAERISKSQGASSDVDRFNEAVALADEGKLELAAERYDQVAATTTQRDLAAMATDRADGIRRALTHKQHLKRYNEAAKAANEGDLETAASILEKLLQELPNGELRLTAERSLREIRGSASSGR